MHDKNKAAKFEAEWLHLQQLIPLAVRKRIFSLVDQHAADLASLFYATLLQDEQAKVFISNELVNKRLYGSMQSWLRELFTTEHQPPQAIYKHQCHVGEIHARIQIPISIVMRSARILKQAISDYLIDSELERTELVKASNFVFETMELALDAMTDSFVVDREKLARADESYRMFALGQNMLAERERQRAALLEWAQQLLLGLLTETHEDELPGIRHSEFGLWLQHKANIIFEAAPELEHIRQRVEQVEHALSIKLAEARQQRSDTRSVMKELETGIAEIKFLLGGLFDRFIEVESGRDSLTRLLNRRHLPAVLTREMAMSRRTESPFSIVLLDIDHFKYINDTFGHTGGDLVLQQASDLLAATVRAGDFIFRYGGEELLVVLVEVGPERALQVAEKIRQRFQEESFRVGEGKLTSVTVSLGVATFHGHPDYETLIQEADRALYSAKKNGRNRSVMA